MVFSSYGGRKSLVNQSLPLPIICREGVTHPDFEPDFFDESFHLFQIELDGWVRNTVFPVP